MSDTFISLVPEKIGNKKEEIHKKVISFLIDRNIIDKNLNPGDNVDSVLIQNKGIFKQLACNQLQVINSNSRQVFDSGSNDVERIVCPSCDENIIDRIDWITAIDNWYLNSGENKIDCPNCFYVDSIQHYIFDPAWGFGELGFVFWNWPEFKNSFIKEIGELINSKFKVVHGKI